MVRRARSWQRKERSLTLPSGPIGPHLRDCCRSRILRPSRRPLSAKTSEPDTTRSCELRALSRSAVSAIRHYPSATSLKAQSPIIICCHSRQGSQPRHTSLRTERLVRQINPPNIGRGRSHTLATGTGLWEGGKEPATSTCSASWCFSSACSFATSSSLAPTAGCGCHWAAAATAASGLTSGGPLALCPARRAAGACEAGTSRPMNDARLGPEH